MVEVLVDETVTATLSSTSWIAEATNFHFGVGVTEYIDFDTLIEHLFGHFAQHVLPQGDLKIAALDKVMALPLYFV